MISTHVKTVLALIFMFCAVVVDFVSGFMSVAFDAVFIGCAVVLLYPAIINDKQT